MRFEWDPRKAAANLPEHGVWFDEAATVFDDPTFITVVDDEHSLDKEHYITIGLSSQAPVAIDSPSRMSWKRPCYQRRQGNKP